MMFHKIKRVAAASCLTSAMALAATASPLSLGEAAAMSPVQLPLTATAGHGNVELVQANPRVRRAYRQGRRAGRQEARQRLRRRYYDGRWYYWDNNGWWYNGSGGAVVAAAGIAGLLAGAALATPRTRTVIVENQGGYGAPYSAEWYRQCSLKYRSFRSSDGTYLGYDGYRHTCTLP